MLANISSWFAAYWPIEAQQEIWTGNPNALICGTFAPTGTCRPVEGGYEISGKWPFSSNCENSDWYYVSAPLTSDDGAPLGPGLFLTPADTLAIDQTSWQVSGLAGSGSKTVFAQQPVFVPAHRMVRLSDINAGKAAGQLIPDNPLAHVRFSTFGASGLVSPLIGMAYGAIDWFSDAMRTKARATSKSGETAATNPLIQRRLGEAMVTIDAAVALLLKELETAETKIFGGEELTVEERINVRKAFAFSTEQARRVVDSLMIVSGASSSDLHNPMQRLWRDLNAGARHVSLDIDGIYTLVGQNLLGAALTGAH
jgi:3-hydroxy-9,10-secoandrosta-1,3,5(10)-triene-9,17-dione monooxygenase